MSPFVLIPAISSGDLDPIRPLCYQMKLSDYNNPNTNTKRIHISRDAVLDEAKAWNWDEQGSGSGTAESELFHLEFTTVSTGREEPQVPHEDDKISAATSEISSNFFCKV